jgi:hypothetical protein
MILYQSNFSPYIYIHKYEEKCLLFVFISIQANTFTSACQDADADVVYHCPGASREKERRGKNL